MLKWHNEKWFMLVWMCAGQRGPCDTRASAAHATALATRVPLRSRSLLAARRHFQTGESVSISGDGYNGLLRCLPGVYSYSYPPYLYVSLMMMMMF